MRTAATIACGFALSLALQAAGAEEAPPDFKISTKRPDDRIEVTHEDDRVIFGVFSPFGIGSATITPTGAAWPKEVMVRLHLRGLESLQVSCGKVTIGSSISSHGDAVQRPCLLQQGKEKGIRKDSPYWMDIKVLGADGKPSPRIPLENGYFEVTLPRALFEGRPEPLTLRWIDFYRG